MPENPADVVRAVQIPIAALVVDQPLEFAKPNNVRILPCHGVEPLGKMVLEAFEQVPPPFEIAWASRELDKSENFRGLLLSKSAHDFRGTKLAVLMEALGSFIQISCIADDEQYSFRLRGEESVVGKLLQVQDGWYHLSSDWIAEWLGEATANRMIREIYGLREPADDASRLRSEAASRPATTKLTVDAPKVRSCALLMRWQTGWRLFLLWNGMSDHCRETGLREKEISYSTSLMFSTEDVARMRSSEISLATMTPLTEASPARFSLTQPM